MRPSKLLAAALVLAACLGPARAAASAQSVPLRGADPPRPLPPTIPIFPLPDVTLFPHTSAPFHIFEPRYRAMVADALRGDSIVGMVVLRPGFETDYEGRPPVYATGCAGVIVSAERLGDGRYDIVLRGVAKFRILAEDSSRVYRLARVEEVPDRVAESDRPLLAARRRQLEATVLARDPRVVRPPAELSDEEVVDAFSLRVPLEPRLRLELLEASGPLERAAALLRMIGGGAQAAR